jgi:hypothetical protein
VSGGLASSSLTICGAAIGVNEEGCFHDGDVEC